MNKRVYTYKKDQYIIREGDAVLGVYFILKGKVRVFSTGFQEKEQIVRFAKDGHILGHMGSGNEEYPISAIAMEESVICFLENDTLNNMFLANPKFTVGVMMFYSRELRKIEVRMKNIAHMNIREKVVDALLLIYENFGLNDAKELNVALSREDIANTVGTNYQQVSRMLTELEDDGLIKKRIKRIALTDIEGLKKIIKNHFH